MSNVYVDSDLEVVDYQIFCLDPKVIDRSSGKSLMLRGPRPNNLDKNNYFVCIGAAQTFGRFCEKPYPSLLQERLGINVLNLGVGAAGPSFFSKDNKELLKYINNAKFAIIQVMSGRSESNSLFISKGTSGLTKVSDGMQISALPAYKELLEQRNNNYIKKIIAETRNNYYQNYKYLLGDIKVPKILFWFSVRTPEQFEKVSWYKLTMKRTFAQNTLLRQISNRLGIFRRYLDSNYLGQFPQLVNKDMVEQIKQDSDEYVQCVSQRGQPHVLVSRFTGQPIKVYDKWSNQTRKKDVYYPSPEMHIDAADALESVCKKYLNLR